MKSRIGRRTRGWVLCATGGLVIAGPSFLPAEDPSIARPPASAPTAVSGSRVPGKTGFARLGPGAGQAHQALLREPRRLPVQEGAPLRAIEVPLAPVQQISGEKSEVAKYMEALYAREVPEAAAEIERPPLMTQQKPSLLKRFFGLFRRRPAAEEQISRHELLPVPPAPTLAPPVSYSTPAVPPAPPVEMVSGPAPAAEPDVPEFNPFDELPDQAGPPPAPPVSEVATVESEEKETVARQPAAGGEFFDPFTEVSEEEADSSRSPYTGLTLTDPLSETPEVAASPAAESSQSVERFEPPIEKQASAAGDRKAAPSADAQIPDPPPAPPQVASGARETEEDEKLLKIKARAHRQGLKGFCPVVLRDERDLRDARPEFSTSYMSVTYYFSSAEAKEKFEAAPEKYAPIQGGTDVVLLVCDQTHARGSIEHAVWYRDRLYLFSDGTSMQTFKEEPSRYAQER